uniref:Uncharacterized protein n=1 Tax=Anguilla anguilla TaxID=7936 RepID=A0A0E9RH64_ANGAN
MSHFLNKCLTIIGAVLRNDFCLLDSVCHSWALEFPPISV